MKQKRISGKKPNRVRMAELFPMGETVVIYGESCVTVRGCRDPCLQSIRDLFADEKKKPHGAGGGADLPFLFGWLHHASGKDLRGGINGR